MKSCFSAACLLVALAVLAAVPVARASRNIVPVKITDSSGSEVGGYAGSHALLVGVSDYTAGWPDLPSVGGELDRVEQALKARGFTVTRVDNPGSREMEDAFRDFIDEYGYDRDNRLLFFFSGHGHSLDKGDKGYLVPADAPDPRKDERGFRRKALDMTQLLSWSRQMTSKHALFLFDSCFSGTIFKTKALPDTPPHITRATALPVRQFITAGEAGEEVPSKSVFTPAFVDAIEYGWGDLNKDGYVTGMELGLYLQSKVPQHARQTPQFGKIQDYDLSRGDFVMLSGGDSGPAAEPVVEPVEGPITGRIFVTAVPADATVRIMNIGPKYRPGIELAPGRYHLRVEKEGYQTLEQWVELDSGQELRVKMELEKGAGLRAGETRKDPTTLMELVWVPDGCFTMGSEDGADDERPAHEVCVDGFWMGKYEVTQAQWRMVMGDNPSNFSGDRNPVEQVSWDMAQEFVKRLNAMGAGGYRLPTEAEWEYAARGGTTTERFWGDDADQACAYANVNDRTGDRVNNIGISFHDCDDGHAVTAPVGSYKPNPFGLHDMLGNVREWVQDAYNEDEGYSSHGRDNPVNLGDGSGAPQRVYRGGAWDDPSTFVRTGFRSGDDPDWGYDTQGFRLVREE